MSTLCDGVFAAFWSPADAAGQLLQEAITANLRFLQGKGLRGLMLLGTTGEFLHLDPATRCQLIESVVRQAGDLTIIANISDIRPRVVVELGRFARSLQIPAAAVLPPYYHALASEDLVEFFVRTGEAVGLPILLYNFPERTGNALTLEIVAAVANRMPILGIKQSGGSFAFHRDLAQLGREKGFVVLTGADTHLVEAMDLGATGCVSGLSDVVPEFVVEVYEAYRAGAPQRAQLARERLKDIGQCIDRVSFPLSIAAAMEARGLPVGTPKAIVSPATQKRYEQLVADLRERFRQWGLASPSHAS